jgi:hypothetical protein
VELTLDEFDSLRAAERWLLAPGHRSTPVDASPEVADRLTREAAALTAQAGELAEGEPRSRRFTAVAKAGV